MFIRLVLALALLAVTSVASTQPADTLSQAMGREVRAVSAARPKAEGQDLREVYEHTGGTPLWVDAAGRATPRVQAGLALLTGATADGLSPADYDLPLLATLAADGDARRAAEPARAARLDVALTAGMLRYFRHLHLGRVDPGRLDLQIDLPIEPHRFSDVLWSALERDRLQEAVTDMAPALAQYGALRTALARYRAISPEDYGTLALPATIKPGAAFGEGAMLRRLPRTQRRA